MVTKCKLKYTKIELSQGCNSIAYAVGAYCIRCLREWLRINNVKSNIHRKTQHYCWHYPLSDECSLLLLILINIVYGLHNNNLEPHYGKKKVFSDFR